MPSSSNSRLVTFANFFCPEPVNFMMWIFIKSKPWNHLASFSYLICRGGSIRWKGGEPKLLTEDWGSRVLASWRGLQGGREILHFWTQFARLGAYFLSNITLKISWSISNKKCLHGLQRFHQFSCGKWSWHVHILAINLLTGYFLSDFSWKVAVWVGKATILE